MTMSGKPHDLTTFIFFKNTPLIDFQNTIHFSSNNERDSFFMSNYEKFMLSETRFNFVRDKSTIRVSKKITGLSYNSFKGVNYCSFISEIEPDIRYYAYVIQYNYINDDVTEIHLMIDPIMTYTQGNVLNNLSNLRINRQHLTPSVYYSNLYELRNNDDILTTYSKSYFNEQGLYFKDLIVLIHCSADLTADFGTEDSPKITTSSGGTIDRVTSPIDIYMVSQSDFLNLMEKLKKFAWISQNIKKVILIPKDFYAETDFQKVNTKFGFNNLFKLKENVLSNTEKLDERLSEIQLTPKQLQEMFKLDSKHDLHLLRNSYFTYEVYTWDGQSLFIDLGKTNLEKGINWKAEKLIGYENEIAFYLEHYKNEHSPSNLDSHLDIEKFGAYLNDCINFKSFDSVPVLIDNAQLNWSKGAYTREAKNNLQISGQIGNVFDSSKDLKDRFFSATSVLSNLNPLNLLGKFSNEHEYFKLQQATKKDLALETPSITEQTNSNSFQIRNNNFGLTIKMSKPSEIEMKKVKKYYCSFGFQWIRDNAKLSDINSMTIANFVSFSGSWSLPDVDVNLMEMMRIQFENGVRLWHNNGTENPMEQDLLNNKMKGV